MRIDTSKRISHRDLDSLIGGFTDPYPYSLRLDHSIGEAVIHLQSIKTERRAEYFYITDTSNLLIGFVTLSDLLYNPSHLRLSDIVDRNVLKVYEDERLDKALHFLSHHQLLVVPVVDRSESLVGILEILPEGKQSKEKRSITNI